MDEVDRMTAKMGRLPNKAFFNPKSAIQNPKWYQFHPRRLLQRDDEN